MSLGIIRKSILTKRDMSARVESKKIPLRNLILSLALFSLLVGCATSSPQTIQSPTKPTWLYDQLVGSAKITASGDKNEQRRVALERAIAELLMLKGEAKGESIAQVQKNLKQSNTQDSHYTNYKSDTQIAIEYKSRPYSVKIVEIYEDPRSEEIFIKIEELK